MGKRAFFTYFTLLTIVLGGAFNSETYGQLPIPQRLPLISDSPVFLEVDVKEIKIDISHSEDWHISEDSIGISVSSLTPWELYCDVTPASPVNEEQILSEDEYSVEIYVLPAFPLEQENFGELVKLEDAPVLISQGSPRPYRAQEVNRLELVVITEGILPATQFTGTFNVYLYDNGGEYTSYSFPYILNNEEFVEISLSTDEILFTASSPGRHYNDDPLGVTVLTNRLDAELSVEISDLVHEHTGFVISSHDIILQLAQTEEQVMQRIRVADQNDGPETFQLQYGENTIFVAGCVEPERKAPAGEYKGVLRVTALPGE